MNIYKVYYNCYIYIMDFNSGGDGSHYDKDNMSDEKAKKIIIAIVCILLIFIVFGVIYS